MPERQKHILLVDDDRDDSDLFQEAMSEIDPAIRCQVATDGFEAMKALSEIGDIDLIFLDINMPGMDGWECLEAIRQSSHAAVPVIVYSTSARQQDIDRAYQNGATYFFTKPFSYLDLKRNLELIVGRLKRGALASMRIPE